MKLEEGAGVLEKDHDLVVDLRSGELFISNCPFRTKTFLLLTTLLISKYFFSIILFIVRY